MAGPIPVREITVGTRTLHLISFVDRRDATNVEEEFLLQSQVQSILFGNEPIGTTGALYRLLNRAGVGPRAVPLRRSSVAAGLVTLEEWEALRTLVYDLLHSGVRAFTLVPIGAVQEAITCFGSTPDSEALLSALGLPRPDAWASGSSSSGEDNGGGVGQEEQLIRVDVKQPLVALRAALRDRVLAIQHLAGLHLSLCI